MSLLVYVTGKLPNSRSAARIIRAARNFAWKVSFSFRMNLIQQLVLCKFSPSHVNKSMRFGRILTGLVEKENTEVLIKKN